MKFNKNINNINKIKILQGSDSYFMNYTKNLNPHEFIEVSHAGNSHESRESKTDDVK